MNAIIKCREPAETPKVVLCTNLPCKMCSKAIVNLGGVTRVIYARDYRLKDGLEILKHVGIETICMMPEAFAFEP
jgi:deoxycytidylate deaminase